MYALFVGLMGLLFNNEYNFEEIYESIYQL